MTVWLTILVLPLSCISGSLSLSSGWLVENFLNHLSLGPFSMLNIPVCCHLFVVGGLRTSVTQIAMLAGVFILLLGPPKPDRLKDRGWTKCSTASISLYFPIFSHFTFLLFSSIVSPFSMLYSSVYNLFALIGRKALSLTLRYGVNLVDVLAMIKWQNWRCKNNLCLEINRSCLIDGNIEYIYSNWFWPCEGNDNLTGINSCVQIYGYDRGVEYIKTPPIPLCPGGTNDVYIYT